MNLDSGQESALLPNSSGRGSETSGQSRKRKETTRATGKSFEMNDRPRKGFRSEIPDGPKRGAAIRNRVYSRLVIDFSKSEFAKTPHEFIPKDVLNGIFSYDKETRIGYEEAACEVLELMSVDPRHATPHEHELAEFVLRDARTIFFIGIYIDHHSLYNMMVLFKMFTFTDLSLPILWDSARWSEASEHPLAIMESKFDAQSTSIWPLPCMHKFQRDQWRFLPATISCARNSHDFGERILPFIEKLPSSHGGAHGLVQAYKIHPAQIVETSYLKQQCDFVAVKEFRHSGERAKREWEQEVNALKTMNTLEHEHIVQFLIAFTRGDEKNLEHYVVFEFADGGNLDDFWRHLPIPILSPTLIKWVFEQIHGLATALAAAHYQKDKTSYRHGDLKPANILWFKSSDSYGTLKIGDWGEARCHDKRTGLRDDTQTRYGTRRYEPPELARPDQVKRSRSRLYDVWSFGCIALEFIIWLLYGRKELDKFNLDNHGKYGPYDMFYELDTNTADSKPIVHQVVSTWIDHMSQQIACRANETALGDLLELVGSGMLVIELPADNQDDDLENHSTETDSSQSMNPSSGTSKMSPSPTPSFQINRSDINTLGDMADSSLAKNQAVRLLATDVEEELFRIKKKAGKEADWSWIQRFRRSPPGAVHSGTHLSLPAGISHRGLKPETAVNQSAASTPV